VIEWRSALYVILGKGKESAWPRMVLFAAYAVVIFGMQRSVLVVLSSRMTD
jgi:hypothetical protein